MWYLWSWYVVFLYSLNDSNFDYLGKRSIVHVVKYGKFSNARIHSTIYDGFEKLTIGNITLGAWLAGGRSGYRPRTKFFYQNSNGFIYVVDSDDRDNIEKAKKELLEIKAEGWFQDIPVLIFANKQDRSDAMSLDEIRDKLCLNELFDEKMVWHLQGASALENKGIQEGLEWLANNIAVPNEIVKPIVETINDSVAMKNDILSKFNLKNCKDKFKKFVDSVSFLFYPNKISLI